MSRMPRNNIHRQVDKSTQATAENTMTI